jgi:sulfite exporter TauE/SafE
MQTDLQVLLGAAIAIAFLHTLTGPDHYLPFIALSRSRKWTLSRTLFWTLLCGCGHVLSSVVLGLGGAAIGWSLSKIKWLEGVRGSVAGWMLLGFGIVYGIWGLVRAKQNKRHKHFDVYDDGSVYVYEHRHGDVVAPKDRHAVTPWVLFLIFVLGPCEPMIPLLYFPAAHASWWGMCLLIFVYSFFTLATMAVVVASGYYGMHFFKAEALEKYMHAISGLAIFICGLGVVFLNW